MKDTASIASRILHWAVTLIICSFFLAACGGNKSEPQHYTVTASAGEGGTIAPARVSVEQGKEASLTITPNIGFRIANASGCGGRLDGTLYTTAPMTADCTVTASFLEASYIVDAIAGDGGSVVPDERTVMHGDTTEFSIEPSQGYQIESVTGCDGQLNKTSYITGPITSRCTIHASFSQQSFTIKATATEGGSVSPSHAEVAYGSSAEFVVSAHPNYVLTDLSGCDGTLTGTRYRTGKVTSNCSIMASFAPQRIESDAAQSDGPLSAQITNTDDAYFHPDTVGFIPVSGHQASPPEAPAAELNFPFGLFHFTAIHRHPGETVTIELSYPEALPDFIEYWKYGPDTAGASDSWYVLPESFYQISADRTRLTLSIQDGELGDTDWIANGIIQDPGGPAIRQYLLSTSSTDGGNISPESALVAHGSQASFTLTPNAGFEVASVSGCNGTLSGHTYTTGPITAACTVEARFQLRQYTLTASTDGQGSITPEQTQVAHGSQASFTLTPNAGFE
ncbi:MAG: hypothetical protein JJU30_12995, partial [Alkalimonas sp.]|nr:hypothetical protein [Alkalimonas sp.]